MRMIENEEEWRVKEEIKQDIRESIGIFNGGVVSGLTNSLELFIESMENMVKCPKCNMLFERVPLSRNDTRKNDKVLDDKGKPITGIQLEHYLEHRFRCMNCTTIFCAQCGIIPYHLGNTCRSVRFSPFPSPFSLFPFSFFYFLPISFFLLFPFPLSSFLSFLFLFPPFPFPSPSPSSSHFLFPRFPSSFFSHFLFPR